MSVETRRALLRRVTFIAWGMLTLALLFCVVLLVVEMVRQGQDPLALARPDPATPLPAAAELLKPAAKREIALYFADSDGHMLVPEMRAIEYSTYTVENCRAAIKQLMEGPQGPLTPILPPSVPVNGIYLLENGELVVDFSIELERAHRKLDSTSLETLMIYGIVNTLTQPALQGDKEGPAAKVRFLIGGARPRDSFPAHVDASGPIAPNPRWIAAPDRSSENRSRS